MQRTSFRDMGCAIAQCLDVVGEWWSLLIIRDVFLGYTRFDDIHGRLGISRNVLNQRLARLVEEGVLEKVPYQDNPPRSDYRLTEKGEDLWRVLGAMRAWGRKWGAPEAMATGEQYDTLHAACGTPVVGQTICPSCEHPVTRADVEYVRAPSPLSRQT
ncbi:MAG: helix-turn-helix HxlR type [Actinomycetia bacterium]|nr:helix-turn-helix HxlR type [Actinomycetes bacterium]